MSALTTVQGVPLAWGATSILRARVRSDKTLVETEMPVLLTSDGCVLRPLLDYLLSRAHDRSVKWMEKRVRACRLFLEYSMVHREDWGSYKLFMNFAQRLYTGTISLGEDPTSLGWTARSGKNVSQIITGLNDLFAFIEETRPELSAPNPHYAGDRFDKIAQQHAYQYSRSKAFLGHNWAEHSEASGRLIRAYRGTSASSNPPKFPESHIDSLIYEGFKTSRGPDYRGMLITLLLHYGGYRVSEPFHMYTSDVHFDPANRNSALVLLHHPELSLAPLDWREASANRFAKRSDYMRQAWNMVPRTELTSTTASGWKGGHHTSMHGNLYFHTHWFPAEKGEVFLDLWKRYLPQMMETERCHPYAFVNLRKNRGEPYKISQYIKARNAAVERIGMTVAKEIGTTSHGHRHAYAQRLIAGGVDPKVVRLCLHHSSMSSQAVYTAPSEVEIANMLKKAADNLNGRAT